MTLIAPILEHGTRCHAGQALTRLACSPEGQYVAVAGYGAVVEVWDVQRGTLCSMYTGHTNVVSSVAWSPDGRCIASSSWDGTVQIWDAATGEHEYTYWRHLNDSASARVNVVAWSPDGRYLASAATDWTIRVWSAQTLRTVQVKSDHLGSILDMRWSPDGRYLVSGGEDGIVRIWDALFFPRPLLTAPAACGRCICAVQWSPNGALIAFLEAGRRVHVWSVATSTLLWCHTQEASGGEDRDRVPDEEIGRAGDLTFSADGCHLVSAGGTGIVCVWNVASGMRVGELCGDEDVCALTFQPTVPPPGQSNLAHLFSGSWNGTMRVWPILL